MCVSDFSAKGVRPEAFMVSVGLTRKVRQREVDELAAGLKDAARRWRLNLVGGDTNESKELVIDCAMLGFAERITTRAGASPGDLLVVTGPFGYQSAGLKILMAEAQAGSRFRQTATRSVLEPEPNLEAGIALAPYLTSSMDSSDGLARSIHTIAKESGVGFELFRLPAGSGVKSFAAANGLDPEKLVLQGGEEYLIVGTVKESQFEKAAAAAKRAGAQLVAIGSANRRKGRVVLKHGKTVRMVRDVGWTHLG